MSAFATCLDLCQRTSCDYCRSSKMAALPVGPPIHHLDGPPEPQRAYVPRNSNLWVENIFVQITGIRLCYSVHVRASECCHQRAILNFGIRRRKALLIISAYVCLLGPTSGYSFKGHPIHDTVGRCPPKSCQTSWPQGLLWSLLLKWQDMVAFRNTFH